MSEPKFQGIWIPVEVLDIGLSTQAKVAYGIIAALDNEDGCFASNGYIGKVLGVSDRQVSSVITELEQSGLITRGTINNVRVIRTIEKEAIQSAVGKILGNEENFLPTQKKTSRGGRRKLPTYSIEDNIDDSNKGLIKLPYSSEKFVDSWNSYTNHRRQLKRPISKAQITSLFEQFVLWGEEKSIRSIQNSILRGWVGVFPDTFIMQRNNKALEQKDHNAF